MEHYLMRKNEIVTICDFTEDGTMIAFSPRFRNPELAPLDFQASDAHIRKWWQNRQIPLRQGRVEDMLRRRGLTAPGEFLLKNLGLSMTDCYWIRPVGSSLRWEDVNLFENDFKENLMDESPENPNDGSREGSSAGSPKGICDGAPKDRLDGSWEGSCDGSPGGHLDGYPDSFSGGHLEVSLAGSIMDNDKALRSGGGSPRFTPNSSLKGELEKSWVIMDGKRVLIKGNHGESSTESINEVIASELHRRQEYDNYTEYQLLHIKGKEYDYGCYSEAFTSNDLELVSAYAVLTSAKKPDGLSDFEFLIQQAEEHGIDGEQFRKDLEYQIITDNILSNVDRHMENIGILRDADSLQFIRMAPIFDTGRAFCSRTMFPYTDEEIDDIEVNSFERKETDLLKLVRHREVCDLSRLPAPEEIEEAYLKDSKMRPNTARNAAHLYKAKTERIRRWQEGK